MQVSEWWPIDTAPKNETVLVWEPSEPAMCYAWWNDGEWTPSHSPFVRFFKQPTYWTVLEPPANG